ncbi:uncharacterized protein LOC129956474 [Argiope bruennichi]|uniref:uncharacterized protein LOC129956474 n=1 Tax=Argiope bruennichi TaxID=94029 RepID=UPI00249560A9|nr:uncharacterized protein LOC129956474 [Argiope bruennichi]
MNWLTTLAFAVLLLSIQCEFTQSASSSSSESPWANPAEASSLMSCLITNLADSDVLPEQEKEDLETVADTLMSAINGASAKGKSSRATLQAINMAVASSLAELVVAEDLGNQASIAVKTQALSGALEQCFQEVMGTVDRRFITEINDLITMFAREAAEDNKTEIGEGELIESSSSDSSSYRETSQSASSTYQSTNTFQESTRTAEGYGKAYFGTQNSRPRPIGTGPLNSYTRPALIERIANALVTTSTFKTVLRTGISQDTLSRVLQRIVQSLANALGIDGNNLYRIALEACTKVPAGSDTNAYALAFSTALINAGILNDTNIDILGSRVLTAVLNGVSDVAKAFGINLELGNVQNDIRSSVSLLSTSSSSSSFSQTAASTTSSSATSIVGQGARSGFATRFANALATTSTFRTVLRRGISQDTLSRVVQRIVQLLANVLGIDGNNLSRIILEACTKVPAGSDTDAYALAFSTALINAGILNDTNIDILGSRILTAVLNGVSDVAKALGINLELGNVQNDISSSISLLSTSSSSSSFSQTAASSTTGAATTIVGQGNGLLNGVPVVSPILDAVIGRGDGTGLVARIANALSNTSTFRTVVRRGVSQDTLSRVLQRIVQSLANALGIDGNNLYRIAIEACTKVPAGSDTNAYALAFSTALVNAGILNDRNIDILGSRVLTAVLNGVSDVAKALGINLELGNVQNDIRSSVSLLSTSSSSSSFSQTAASSTTGAATTIVGQGNGLLNGVPVVSPILDAVIGRGDGTGLVARIANALANTSTFRTVVRRGVSQDTLSRVLQRIVQSLANALGIDGNNLYRIALEACTKVPAGSDTNAYALAFSTALINAGILNDTNIDILGSRVLTAVLNGVSDVAKALGINLELGNVQNDIRSSVGLLSTSSSSSSFSQTAASTTSSSATSIVGQGARSGFATRFANALATTSTFRTVLRRGISQDTLSRVVQRIVQLLANVLGIDGNNLSRIILEACTKVPAGSDTDAYALAFSTALINAGILNDTNIDILGSRILTAVLNGVSDVAKALGINLELGNVQNDISSSISLLSTSSSSSSFSQTAASSTTGAATTIVGQGNGLLNGVPVVSPILDAVIGRGDGTGLVARIANALSNTSTFRTVVRRGVSQDTLSRVLQRIVQSLANALGIDGNNLYRIAIEACTKVPAGSDTNAYALAFSTALVNAGILNDRNIDILGSRVLTAVLNGVSDVAKALGINLELGNVQNDIRSSVSLLSTSSSSSSFSQTAASSTTGAATTIVGQGNGLLNGVPVVSPILEAVIGRGDGTGLVARIANALANTSTFRTVVRRGVSQDTLSRVLQRIVQSLANALGIDGNNLYRIALEACTKVPAGSDTNAYALAFSTALINAGILNDTNIDILGSRVLTAVLNGVSDVAKALGINLELGNVQNDIRSSVSLLSTSSSSSSFSQTAASTTSSSATSIVGQGARSGFATRFANALATTSTFRTVLRRGISQDTLSRVVQRIVQLLANVLGIDGNNLSRIILEACTKVPAGSDTDAYALAFSTALINAGILNDTNIDILGSRILTAVLNGVSDVAKALGINLELGNVQNDISSSISLLSTSSSSSSFSQTAASSTTGAATTIVGQGNGLLNGVPVVSPILDAVIGRGDGTGLVARIANALSNTSTFRTVVRRGVSQDTLSRVLQRIVQSLANALGIDGNNLYRIAIEACTKVPAGSDTNAYALAFSTALVNAGILNDRNIDILGSRVLTAVLNGVSDVAKALGINLELGNVQNDIRSSVSLLSTSSSSSSFSQTAASSTTGAATTIVGQGNGLLNGVPVVSPILDAVIGRGDGTGLVARIANALANTSTFRTVVRRGVSQDTLSRVLQRIVQSLANALGIDGNNLYRIALEACTKVPAGSDTNAYALAFSTALINAGILNDTNIDILGSRVLTAVLNGVSDVAKALGINLELGNVQNDIRSSVSLLSTSSSSSSFSQTAASTTSSSATSIVGQGARSGFATRFANALATTSTFRTVLRRGISQDTLSRVVQRIVQLLANVLGIDGNNLSRIILEACTKVPAGSDTDAYALAFSTALINAGILNDTNIDILGSRILTAVLNGVSDVAKALGINLELGNVQNDISSSISLLSTSSSSSSFSQTAASSTTGAATTIVGQGNGLLNGVPVVSPILDAVIGRGDGTGLVARIANALSNTSTFRTVVRRGVSQDTLSRVLQRIVQSLANALGIDGNNLYRIAIEACTKVPAGSDTNAYALAFSTALVNAGILNDRNIDILGSRVLTAVLNGVSDVAKALGINLELGNVQNDIRSSVSLLSTSSSSSSFSQTAASSTTGAATTIVGQGNGLLNGVPVVSPILEAVIGRGDGTGLVARIANALANTSTFRTVVRRGVSQDTLSRVLQRIVQSLANALGIDGNNLYRIALEACTKVPAGSDTNAYALAFSTALINAGILNDTNIDILGSRVLTAVLNGVSDVAKALGINLELGNVQNDIRSSVSLLSTSSSSSSFSQTAASTTSSSATSIVGQGARSGFATRFANALATTSTFRTVLRRGISQDTLSRVVQRIVQLLANVLGIDGNNLSRIILEACTKVPAGSDTDAYALAFSTALINAGILNDTNIDILGSRILTAVLNGVSDVAKALGINLELGNVQNDISSSISLLSTSSSSSSFSQTAASSTTGAATTIVGQGNGLLNGVPVVSPILDAVIGRGDGTGLVARIANALSNTSTFRTVVRRGVSQDTLSRVLQRIVQSLANALGIDGNNLYRIAIEACTKVPAGSDTNAYALAFSTALVNAGILNDRNIDILGSRVLTAVLNGVSDVAKALGINLELGNVQNDIRSSVSLLSTSSSSSSFSQTAASSTTGAATTIVGQGNGLLNGVPVVSPILDAVIGRGDGTGLVARIANALANTSTFRTVVRRGVSQDTLSRVLQRIVQSLANALGIDGNNLYRIALEACTKVPAGSDTNAYALAFSTALINAGILNDTNIDILGSRVLTAVLNGVSDVAKALGINLELGNVQNDIRSSVSLLSTSSSSSSFSQTAASTTSSSATSIVGQGARSGFATRFANALATTSTFRTVLRRGISQDTLSRVVQRIVQLLANVLGIDGNNLSRIILEACTKVPAGSDTDAYALAFSTALINAGILNDTNIDILGSRILTAVLNGVSDVAKALGINLELGNVQNDISSSISLLSTSSSSSSFSQTAASSTTGAATTIVGQGNGLLNGVPVVSPILDAVIGRGDGTGLVARIANALSNTSTFRTVVRRGVSQDTLSRVLQRIVQSLANALGIDGNNLYRIALEACTKVPAGSDTNAYALAFSTALINAGILNDTNIDILGSRVLTAVLNGVSDVAKALGINLELGNVQNDIRSSVSLLSTSSSSSSFSQTAASTTSSSATSIVGQGARSGFATRFANALATTSTFRTVLRRGISQDTLSRVVQRIVQLLANVLGIDGNNLSRIILEACTKVPAGSDTDAYALAFSTALINAGILNDTNIDILGSRILTAVLNGVSDVAKALGINLELGNVQNDISSSISLLSTSSSSSSFSQTAASSTTGAATTIVGQGNGLLNGVPVVSPILDAVIGRGDGTGLVARIANALANTSTFRTVVRRGVSQDTLSRVLQRIVQSLANALGIDGNNLYRIALEACTKVPAGSDTNAYALAFSTALINAGILNDTNIDILGSRVLTAVLNGVSDVAKALGINLELGNVQNDIRSSVSLLSTSSSSSSFSQTAASTTSSSATSIVGQGARSGFATRFANALATTSTFRTVLRRGISQDTLSRVVQRIVQLLANVLGIDGNNLSRIILEACTKVPAGSDTDAYALAFSTALINAGILNDTNIDILGSRILTAVLNGVSDVAKALGINLELGNVQNDISSSISLLSTSSSSSSFSQTAASSTTGAATTIVGQGNGLLNGVPVVSPILDAVIGRGDGTGLVARIANALSNTSTFRTVVRRGVSQDTLSRVLQRIVQSLANALGIDGNNLYRIALEACTKVPAGSDTNAYALAFSTALINAGILNDTNIDILGSRVLTAVLNGVSDVAKALGINLELGNVQNDIRSSVSLLSTSSSSSSFSQTAASTTSSSATSIVGQGARSGFATRFANALATTSTFRTVLRRGISQDTLSRVVQRIVQLLANVLGIDGNNLSRIILEACTKVPAGSDTDAYALAFSTALINAGILNDTNIDILGSRILTAVLNGVSDVAKALGINLELGNVQNDISSSISLLSTSSSSSSFSQTAASSTTGAATTIVGQGNGLLNGVPVVSPILDAVIGRGDGTGLVARIANALSNTSTFRTVVRRGVSQDTLSRVLQRIVQSLANALGIDGNNLYRIALEACTKVPAGSDTNAYALAFSTALINAGILNDTNIDILGSRVLTAVLNGVSDVAKALGINLELGNVQNDIRSSVSLLSTSSSSSSFSQTAASTTSSSATSIVGQGARSGFATRFANALATTSTFRTVLRRGISQDTLSRVVQRIVQLLANVLGIDGNNLSRIILEACTKVPAGSDTDAYALAFSTALINAGILNDTNIDILGSRILTAVLNGVSDVAKALGINLELGNVQNDISSSISLLSTSSSSSSFSQTAASSTTGAATTIVGQGNGLLNGVPVVSPILDAVIGRGDGTGLVARIANALSNTSTFRTVVRRGVSQDTLSRVLQRIVQSLANALGIDGNNLYRIAIEACTKVPAGSDTNAYALAFSTALVNAGILNDRNIDILGSRVLTAVLNGVSDVAKALGINLELGNVQNDIRSSVSLLSTSSSSSSFSQTAASSTTGAATTIVGQGNGLLNGVPVVSPILDAVIGRGDGTGLVARIANALANTSTFRTVVRRGVSQDTLSRVLQRIVQSLANALGIDGNNLYRIALEACTKVPAGSDTNAYALAFSTALINAGILNDTNIDILGSRVLTAVLNGVSDVAKALGINLELGNVQNDIRSSVSLLSTSSSSSSFSQTAASTTSSSATSIVGQGARSGFATRFANALATTSTFRTVLRRGISQDTLSRVVQRIVQLLANVLGIDGNNLSRIILEACTKVPAGSDTDAYALAFSTALINAGILNDTNIDILGSRILTAVLNGVSDVAKALGINLELGNVQNDISSSISLLSTSSSSSSFSQTAASSTTGAATTIVGQGNGLLNGVPVVSPILDAVIGRGDGTGLVARIANALSNTSTFRTVVRRGVSQDTLSRVLQRIVQSLANALGIDGNNLYRIALEACTKVPAGSDTNAYALAFSTALINAGILNDTNIDILGSRVLTAVLNGVSDVAKALGINLELGNVQNDIRSSVSLLSTSSSSSSFSQTAASTTSSSATSIVGQGARSGFATRFANALATTSTFRTVLRRGISQDTLSRVVQRIVQLLANVLGIDGNNLSRIILEACTKVPAGSDTDAYALAFSTALINAGILNDTNIDILGSRILTAVLNGVSDVAKALGINLELGNVQNDISSSISLLSTSSSSSSFSQTAASSTTGAATTIVGQGNGLLNGVPVVSPILDAVIGRGDGTGLVARIANALSNTSTFRTVVRRGVSQDTLSRVLQRIVQSLANALGIDGNNLYRIAIEACTKVPAGSDTNAYALAFSTALVNAGILNDRNIDILGSRVLTAVLNGVSDVAKALGINLELGNVQNDIRSSVSLLSTSSSSSSFSQTAASSTTGAATTIVGQGNGLLNGVPVVSPILDAVIGRGDGTGLVARIANALANTSTFRTVVRRGVSQDTLSRVLQRIVQSLANALGIDGNNLYRIALEACTKVPAGSDTNAYALAFSTALINAGILNDTNIDILGSRVLTAVLNGVSDVAKALGINLELGNVQNDIRSSVSLLSTSSSSSSFSQTAASTTSSSATSIVGQGARSGFATRFANALATTSTFRTVLRRGISQDTLSRVVQRIVQLLANVLGIDGNNLSRIILEACTKVPAGSDTDAYALAFSTALINAGILNETNIDILGSRVLTAVLNGVSDVAKALGINLELGNVQNDIRSSVSLLSTSSSSSSFSQTAASSTTGAATTIVGQGNGLLNGVPVVSPILDAVIGRGDGTGLVARIANALANTSTFRTVVRRGVSQDTLSRVLQRIVQSLANALGIDGNNLYRIAIEACTKVPAGSDTNAYALAFSTALVNAGILNDRNIDILGSRVLTAVLNGVSDVAKALGINLELGNVQNDIRSSVSLLSTSSSSSSFSQTAASSTTGAATTIVGQGNGLLNGVPVVSPILDAVIGRGDGTGLVARIANALANTSTFRTVVRRGVSQDTLSRVLQRIVQSLANALGIDGNNLYRIALEACTKVPAGSDTNAYALAFSTALINAGILNDTNIDILGSRVLTAVLNGVSDVAKALGINLELGNVQNDIRSSVSLLSTSSSSSSFSQTAASTTSSSATSIVGQGARSGFATRFANALATTSTFRTVLRRGISQDTLSRVVQRIVQLLANDLGIDGNNLSRIILEACTKVPAGSDTDAYALAFSTALINAGILNETNIDILGSRVLTAVLNGVSDVAKALGINLELGNVQNDIRSSVSLLSTSSSSSSFSQTAASSTTGAATTIVGQGNGLLNGVPVVSPILDAVIGRGDGTGLVARIANALANTSTFRTVVRRGVSQDTLSRVLQRIVQSLANALGIDGNNLYRIALEACTKVPAGSDTNAYALAFSTALINAGILNDTNIDILGSRVLTAVLNGVSDVAKALGINLELGNVQNDIRSSVSLLSTSSSSSSFSQTAASTTSSSATSIVGQGARSGFATRFANALATTSTFRTVLRRGISQDTLSRVVQRIVQLLANVLGIDGNNLSRIILEACTKVPAGSDTDAYALAFSTALINAGILNETNIDILGSRVLTAVLNGVSDVAKALGINLEFGNVQNDIRSSVSLLSTSSSSSSFSQTAASSTTGAATTIVGQGNGLLNGVPVVSPILDAVIGRGDGTGLVARIANALANTSTFRTVVRRGVSQDTLSSVVKRIVQSLANALGIDGNNLYRIAVEACNKVPAGSDTNAYALAFSTALVNAGILNDRNVGVLASRVVSAVLRGVSNVAQSLGINLDRGNIQKDIRSSISLLSSSSTSSSMSRTAASTFSGASSSTVLTGAGRSKVLGGATQLGGRSQTFGMASTTVGKSAEISVRSTLNSPNGLKSDSAAARINQMRSTLLKALSPSGVDPNTLAGSLQASFSNLRSSGMSSSDAKVEVLLETIVGLLQILSNAEVHEVNSATSSSVISSAVRSFELALP